MTYRYELRILHKIVEFYTYIHNEEKELLFVAGGSEQVKQVKQLLHWNSEAERAKNLANW